MLVLASLLSMALIYPAQQDQTAPTQEAAPAAAATSLPPVTVTAENARQDPNREVCRRQAASVGSNRTRRICAPAWQWEQAREETRDQLLRNSNGLANAAGATEGGDAPPGRGF